MKAAVDYKALLAQGRAEERRYRLRIHIPILLCVVGTVVYFCTLHTWFAGLIIYMFWALILIALGLLFAFRMVPKVTIAEELIAEEIDSTFVLQGRLTTLKSLEQFKNGENHLQRILLARQIQEALESDRDEKTNLIAFRYARAERCTWIIAIMTILGLAIGVTNRSVSIFEYEAKNIATVLRNNPQLPDPVRVEAQRLVTALIDPQRGSESIAEALASAESALLAEIKKSEATQGAQAGMSAPPPESAEQGSAALTTPPDVQTSRHQESQSARIESKSDSGENTEEKNNRGQSDDRDAMSEQSVQDSSRKNQQDQKNETGDSQRGRSQGESEKPESKQDSQGAKRTGADKTEQDEDSNSSDNPSEDKQQKSDSSDGKSQSEKSGESSNGGSGNGNSGNGESDAGEGAGSGKAGSSEGQAGTQPSSDSPAGQSSSENSSRGTSKSGEGSADSSGSEKTSGESGTQKRQGEKGESGEMSGVGETEGLRQLQQAVSKAKEAFNNNKDQGEENKSDSSGNKKTEGKDEFREGAKPGQTKSDDNDSERSPREAGGKSDNKLNSLGERDGRGDEPNKPKSAKDKKRSSKEQNTKVDQDGRQKGSEQKEESKNLTRRDASTQSNGERSPEIDRSAEPKDRRDDKRRSSPEGVGSSRAFKEILREAEDESIKSEYASEKGELQRNDERVSAQTTLEDIKLSRPRIREQREKQPIPLEYREILR